MQSTDKNNATHNSLSTNPTTDTTTSTDNNTSPDNTNSSSVINTIDNLINSKDSIEVSKHNSFIQRKRSRSTKACISCHNRKVKCDVANKPNNSKCTNCLYSGSECVIYVRKKRSANKKRALFIPPVDEAVLSNSNELLSEPSFPKENAILQNMDPIVHSISKSPTNDIVSSTTSNIPSKLSNLLSSSENTRNTATNESKRTCNSGVNLNGSNNCDTETYSRRNSGKTKNDNISISLGSSNDNDKDQAKSKLNDVSILSSNLNDLDSCHERKPSSDIPNFTRSFLTPSAHQQYQYLSSIKLDPSVVLKENMHDLMKTEFGINKNTNHFMKEILDSALSKITESYKRTYTMDQTDYKILEEVGCFSIPDEETCWKFIHNYFEYINPQLPLIDKTNFYETYADLRNPPSLLLLNSVLFVGAWHTNSESESSEEQFESVKIAQVFLKRARYLYEYSIECEPIALIQSLLCFCFDNENMSNIAKNDYYWVHTAVGVAYAYGFHQKPASNLPSYKKRMQKRLFWILFFKDRITAFGYSRPSAINLNDCDQDMLNLSDLSNSGMTHLEQIYLINLLKFGKLLDKIGAIQHEITKLYTNRRSVLHLMKKCDLIMIKFLENLPKELKFKFNDKSTHSFLSLMLLSQYYTLLIVIHRANILRHSADVYPSWAITFQAVQMIKLLSDCLVAKNLIKKVALLSHNTLTSPAIIMLYHLLNEDEKISKIANEFFLRILGIWRATYRKFPVVYPMMCIFGYIYNSEEYLKEIVKSVAPKYNSADDSPGIGARDNTKQEPNKVPLKLPDLSFIANPGFRIHNMVDPFKLNPDPNASKFESLGVNFDKLFTESVFAKGETLVPKLDLESISKISKLRPKNQKSPKVFKSAAEKDTKIEDTKIKVEMMGSNPDTPSTRSENNTESVISRTPLSTANNANDFNNTNIPTSTAPISGLDPSLRSDDYLQETNQANSSFPELSNLMMNPMANQDENRGYEAKMQTSIIDIPISLWMMKANWKPKFNVNLEETTRDINKDDASNSQETQARESDGYSSDKGGGRVENFYGDVYQIMGGAYKELREDNNSEGGSMMNSAYDPLHPTIWNTTNNSEPDENRYQLPTFDRLPHSNMPPSESADTLHKYRYNLNRHSDSTLLSSSVPNIQAAGQAPTYPHQSVDCVMPQPIAANLSGQNSAPLDTDLATKNSKLHTLNIPIQPGVPPSKLPPQLPPQLPLLSNFHQPPSAAPGVQFQSQQQHDYYQEQNYSSESTNRSQPLQTFEHLNKPYSQDNIFTSHDFGNSLNTYNPVISQQQQTRPQTQTQPQLPPQSQPQAASSQHQQLQQYQHQHQHQLHHQLQHQHQHQHQHHQHNQHQNHQHYYQQQHHPQTQPQHQPQPQQSQHHPQMQLYQQAAQSPQHQHLQRLQQPSQHQRQSQPPQ